MLGNKKQEYEMKNEELFKKIHEILIRDWDQSEFQISRMLMMNMTFISREL